MIEVKTSKSQQKVSVEKRVADCLRKIDLGLPSSAVANTTGKKRQLAKKVKKTEKNAAGKPNSEPKPEPPVVSGASEAA